MDEKARSTGMLPVRSWSGDREPWHGASEVHWSDTFICHLGMPDLPSLRPGQNALQVLLNEHECPQFIEWRPGKNPREHEEMTILQHVRAEQAQFREDERNERERWRREDLKWQMQQEALAEIRHQDNLTVARSSGRTARNSAVAAAILAGISALAAAAMALAAWWPKAQ